MSNIFVRRVIELIKKFPGVMPTVLYCERRWPGQWAKLMKVVAPRSEVVPIHQTNQFSYDDLTPRAQRIYDELIVAIATKRK